MWPPVEWTGGGEHLFPRDLSWQHRTGTAYPRKNGTIRQTTCSLWEEPQHTWYRLYGYIVSYYIPVQALYFTSDRQNNSSKGTCFVLGCGAWQPWRLTLRLCCSQYLCACPSQFYCCFSSSSKASSNPRPKYCALVQIAEQQHLPLIL